MSDSTVLRQLIRERYKQTEPEIVSELLSEATLSLRERHMLSERAADIVATIRKQNNPSIMESFLSEYGLSTKEGVGLMCLAEALLRVPDSDTIDELIADKIEPSNWGQHLGQSSSSLVNASTWALLLTGQILDDASSEGDTANAIAALRQVIKRLGEPVVRTAVSQAMKMLGKQFVLGQTIDEAIVEATDLEASGYTYSYDMLGEAARTYEDAERYFTAYAKAIEKISAVQGSDVASKPGISIKLSALHPRYEHAQLEAVMSEMLPRVKTLVNLACAANIGLNIDAEEADRLDLSLNVIDELLDMSEHRQWHGFGVVLQAYSRRALPVLDWLMHECRSKKRRIMVRLVKGAYWDAEIKQAQELGLKNFPVYTRKAHTDVSYIVCAQRLLDNRDIIYPQFATHNAHTVSAIRYLAGADTGSYEFQRLHGMGEALHDHVLTKHKTRCRIYAPVGAHVDLLAYLVRRLLENGANSSFVNQIVNTDLSPAEVARCPIEEAKSFADTEHPAIKKPLDLYAPERINSRGYRINDPASVQSLLDAREHFHQHQWVAVPLIDGHSEAQQSVNVVNPARPHDVVGTVVEATTVDVMHAIENAVGTQANWSDTPAQQRASCLHKASDLYENHIAELSALLCREAGKHLSDAIAEVREAVDFLRYYAIEAEHINTGKTARGLIACISPWNFPLAIFSGQIAAALAAGNVVIAKPAQQTPLIAARAVALMHEAGIPVPALQLTPGDGANIGNTLVSDPRINGVCFTGSTLVAQHINRTLAHRPSQPDHANIDLDPMLIAETGGLNAMIVDTTALTEQVVRDVLESAFQSAGQRCSALRILYVQEEAEERLLDMLTGALDTLSIGDPWHLSTDIGPVIDSNAKEKIDNYLASKEQGNSVLKRLNVPETGTYCSPAIVRVSGIADMQEEIFGPVLHVASYQSDQLDGVIDSINASGYGLTFGLHTRIDDRVQHIVDRVHAGNVYVNRNQIGAVVGSQPFGGEGLSGTGPKAGGPHYLPRFYQSRHCCIQGEQEIVEHDKYMDTADIENALSQLVQPQPNIATENQLMPGPTGESNQLSIYPCGKVLVLSNSAEGAMVLASTALKAGCAVLIICEESINASDTEALQSSAKENACVTMQGNVSLNALGSVTGIDAVAMHHGQAQTLLAKQIIADRDGRIIPFVVHSDEGRRFSIERHVCIDTTAAGGNASLLASAE